MWCFAPTEWNGSTTLYYRFIRPFILRHQDKIDKAMDEAKDAFSEGQYSLVPFGGESSVFSLLSEKKEVVVGARLWNILLLFCGNTSHC